MQNDITKSRGDLDSFMRAELTPLSLLLYAISIALALAAAFLHQSPPLSESEAARLMRAWGQPDSGTDKRQDGKDVDASHERALSLRRSSRSSATTEIKQTPAKGTRAT